MLVRSWRSPAWKARQASRPSGEGAASIMACRVRAMHGSVWKARQASWPGASRRGLEWPGNEGVASFTARRAPDRGAIEILFFFEVLSMRWLPSCSDGAVVTRIFPRLSKGIRVNMHRLKNSPGGQLLLPKSGTRSVCHCDLVSGQRAGGRSCKLVYAPVLKPTTNLTKPEYKIAETT